MPFTENQTPEGDDLGLVSLHGGAVLILETHFTKYKRRLRANQGLLKGASDLSESAYPPILESLPPTSEIYVSVMASKEMLTVSVAFYSPWR